MIWKDFSFAYDFHLGRSSSPLFPLKCLKYLRNPKRMVLTCDPAKHSLAISGLSLEEDSSQKNGVRKISGSYLSAPIFLTFFFILVKFFGRFTGR
jgi:hypothetical protein